MRIVLRCRRIVGTLVVVCAAAITTSTLAQTSTKSPAIDAKSTRMTASQEKDLTAYYASKLFMANYCETELSRIAATRASHPELQRFAKESHREHLALVESLRSMVPSAVAAVAPAAKPASTSSPRTNNRGSDDEDDLFDEDDPESEETASINSGNEQVTAKRATYIEISDPVLRRISEIESGLTRSRLKNASLAMNQMQGIEFDAAFINHEIASHENLLSELKAINGVGSTEFQSLVTRTTRMLNSHLTAARDLAQTIEADMEVEDVEDEDEEIDDEQWEDDGGGDEDDDDDDGLNR